MEAIEQKKKLPWKKRISLKGALVVTTLACVAAGFLLCTAEFFFLGSLHNWIYETYVTPYLPDTSEYFYTDSGDKTRIYLHAVLPKAYIDPTTGESFPIEEYDAVCFIPEGLPRFFYKYPGPISVLLCTVTAMLFFVLDAFWFFRWKVKKPLAVLSTASEKIARNDLDFTISPPSGDELGRLCSSFEKMRSSLEENNRTLWRAMEERRQLNSAFAHDLRTPLTVLRGYSDYLSEGLPTGKILPEKAAETVAVMHRSLLRLQRYVEGMSSLQKLEDISPQKKEVTFSQLAAHLQETGKILQSGLCLSFSSSGAGNLFLDEELVLQVFENLMSNSLRYAAKNIWVTLKAEKTFLTLLVADDGPGFSKEGLKRAVQPYFRCETTQKDEHLGLGLFICRLLCEKHGGRLLLENRPQGGAKLTAVFSVSM